jgi:hypothetical protein
MLLIYNKIKEVYMRYQKRSIKKIDDDIKSASQSFCGYYIEDMLNRLNSFEDKVSKGKIIDEYFDEQKVFSDKESSGTRVRVNSVIRIIKANKTRYALEKIVRSAPGVDLKSIERAKTLLTKIETGMYIVPEFK